MRLRPWNNFFSYFELKQKEKKSAKRIVYICLLCCTSFTIIDHIFNRVLFRFQFWFCLELKRLQETEAVEVQVAVDTHALSTIVIVFIVRKVPGAIMSLATQRKTTWSGACARSPTCFCSSTRRLPCIDYRAKFKFVFRTDSSASQVWGADQTGNQLRNNRTCCSIDDAMDTTVS